MMTKTGLKKRKHRLTRGERNCKWIERYCIVPEGKYVGKKFKLRPFQKKFILDVYDNPHGTITGILSFGRKNSKTSLSSCLLLLHLMGPEAQYNSQLYSTAHSKDQAALVYNYVEKMVNFNPDLRMCIRSQDHKKQMSCPDLGTTYKALSSDVETNLGLSTAFVIHDELGQIRTPTHPLYDALETSTGSYDNPLSLIISTQAESDNALLSTLIDLALTGIDPQMVVNLYTAPMELDPFSEQAIRLANPAYGDFLSKKVVDNQAKRACSLPATENMYRNLVLNQRVSVGNLLIDSVTWNNNNHIVKEEVFRYNRVYAGLDLSEKTALTALCLLAQDEGVKHLKVFYFTPEEGILSRSRIDKVPYQKWIDQGLLITTPGKVVDYSFVVSFLISLVEEKGYNLVTLGYDRWRIEYFKKELARAYEEKGQSPPFHLSAVSQSFRELSPVIDALEEDFISNRIAHGNNPILTWNFANAIVINNANKDRRLDKKSSTSRIDGCSALLCAYRASVLEKTEESSDLVEIEYTAGSLFNEN